MSHKECAYVCGPMAGMPDHNREAFYAASADLTENTNYEILNPWLLNELDTTEPGSQPHTFYMYRDLAWMFQRRTKAIIRLPGWYNSLGACVETLVALATGMEVYNYAPGEPCRLAGPYGFHTTREIEHIIRRILGYFK